MKFWLEYNFGDFAWKLADTIFRGPRHNWKNLLQEKKKKKLVEIWSKMSIGPTGHKICTK